MCYYPKWRLPVSKYAVIPSHKKMGLGWNDNSQAFVFDKRNVDCLEYLLNQYPGRIDSLEEIPCGQCMECRIHKSKELAQRALAEATMHNENYFITLTYDDEHLVSTFRKCVSRHTGEPGYFPTLIKKDFQDFAKRLRERIAYRGGQPFKIFYCGEYGGLNGRPHFHFIAYGLEITDTLKSFKTYNLNGKTCEYLVSDLIEDCWDKGFITIAEVNWETCSYVARYVTKKMIGKSESDYQDLCDSLNFEPQQREFHEVPRRPGLGFEFYEENKEAIYKFDKVVLPGGKSLKPCSYYDKKFDVENPELLALNKEQRKKSMQLRRLELYKGMTASEVERAEKQRIQRSERLLKNMQKRGL